MDMSFLGHPGDGDPIGHEAFTDADRVSADDTVHAHDVAHIVPDQDVGAHSPENHLWMHQDGRVWDLGPADVDTDNDGVRDSLTRHGPDGMTVYTDSDHDGQIDRITEVDAQGTFTSSSLDHSSGAWVPTDCGRLG